MIEIKYVMVNGYLEPTNHPDMIELKRFSDHIMEQRHVK